MSTHYTTEPAPSATVLLHTTAGPLTLSLFATQTPLASRNFIQHVLDGYYDNCLFHRVSAGFVIQTGDPTGTGEGGENIYDSGREFERYDAAWARELGREVGEKLVLGDEVHGRLKFNRRGLVGLAKMGEGYGSQFFVTLGDVRRELDGKCTMFGRVEGEGIYNVVRIAEGEVAEGTERPVFPEKISKAEVLELPKAECWQAMRKRERAINKTDVEEERPKKIAKKKNAKGGKALLSFGGDDEDDGAILVKPKKAKFNPTLIDGGDVVEEEEEEKTKSNGNTSTKHKVPPPTRRKDRSLSPKVTAISTRTAISPSISRSPEAQQRRKPSFHDSTTQFPIRDPEIPSRSRSRSATPIPRLPNHSKLASSTSTLNAEIAALKASMRRDVAPAALTQTKKSALEQMIPATSTKGRKRPRPGDTGSNAKEDATALKLLSAFKARLEGADTEEAKRNKRKEEMNGHASGRQQKSSTSGSYREADTEMAEAEAEAQGDDEATLCDLHFIANCQSCSSWDRNIIDPENPVSSSTVKHKDQKNENGSDDDDDDDDDDRTWLSHKLSFAKDRLGKDLNWKKKKNFGREGVGGDDDDDGGLVVIDPREKGERLKREMRDQRKGGGTGIGGPSGYKR